MCVIFWDYVYVYFLCCVTVWQTLLSRLQNSSLSITDRAATLQVDHVTFVGDMQYVALSQMPHIAAICSFELYNRLKRIGRLPAKVTSNNWFHRMYHKKHLAVFNRVATHLENLEKSGNSKVVREKSEKMKKVRGNWSQYHCTVQLPLTQVLILLTSVRYLLILIHWSAHH